jgi:hypothetical protein
MSVVVDVRRSGYADAATLLADVVADGAHRAWHDLLAALLDTHGMAGTDDIGSSWGASYDGAVEAVRLASQDLVNAFFQLAALLEQTAINYDGADASSVPGAPARVAKNRWTRTSVPLGDPPSAVGQGCPDPHGWSLLQHAIGMLWPNGHQDLLRASARAWTAAADRLQSLSGFIGEAAQRVLLQRAPEAEAAFTAVDAMTAHVADVASAYRRIADACDEYAEHLDRAHHQIISEITGFLEWSAGIEIAGGVFAVLTAGISEAVAQAGEATEIARAAHAIRSAIATLGSLVAVGREAVAAAGARVLGVVERLRPLLMRSPQEVELQQAARTEVLRPGGPLPGEVPVAAVGSAPQARAVANLADAAPSWTSPTALLRHFRDHAKDFGVSTPADYAAKAKAFYRRGQEEHLPTKVDADGTVRIYDRGTNTFGAFTKAGVPKTFFKPTSPSYWERQGGIPR